MGVDKILAHDRIARFGLYSLGHHRLVRDQQQGPERNTIFEARRKQSRRFHVNGHGPHLFEVGFKGFVVLPNASIRGVHGSRPVITGTIPDNVGHRALQRKGRQRGHFRWEVSIGGTFPTNCSDGDNVIAYFGSLFEPPAFPQKQHGFGTNGT